MHIIVGLGNPGTKYQSNRHNVGFQFIDYIIENLQIPNSKSQDPNKFESPNTKLKKNLSSIIYHLSSNTILVKPQTFMNLSGVAVKKLISNFKFQISNLIIIHDDLDIPLGKFRIDLGRGPKLHNGLASIEQHLKTKDFLRVRIGIDNRMSSIELSGVARRRMVPGETYVLQNFRPEEKEIIQQLFSVIFSRLKSQLISSPEPPDFNRRG